MQAVGKRSRSRLVDEAQDFEAGKLASVLRGLALRVIEISRHGDDRAIDGFTKKGFCPIFQLAQNERRDFRGVKALPPRITRMTFLLDGSMRNRKKFSSPWTSAGPRPISRFTE